MRQIVTLSNIPIFTLDTTACRVVQRMASADIKLPVASRQHVDYRQ